MADYTYDSELVADPFSFQRAANASITVFDSNDENETTPLVLKDLTGLPLPNPLASNADAFVPAFVAPSAQVKMVGGGLRVVRASFQGVRDEAVAAKLAAEESQLAASQAASLVGAPADAAIAAAVSSASSSTRTALNATYATAASVSSAVALKLDSAVAASTYATQALTKRGVRFAHLGDSLSTTVSGGANTHWAWLTPFLLGGSLVHVLNAGIAGNTSTQILARVPDVVATGVRYCTVLAGANDHDSAATIAKLPQIYAALVAANIEPIPVLMLPNNADAELPRIAAVNAWIMEYAEERGWLVLDAHTPLADPITGKYRIGTNYDGTHPNETGHLALGRAFAVQLAGRLGWKPKLTDHSSDPLNCGGGGVMSLISATSPNQAALWTTSFASGTAPAASVSLVPAVSADGVNGNWQRITLAPGNNGTYLFRRLTTLASMGVNVGDTLRLGFRLRSSGHEAQGSTFAVSIGFTGSSTVIYPIRSWSADVDGAFVEEFVIPAGATELKIEFTAGSTSATPGTATVDLAALTLRNMTTQTLRSPIFATVTNIITNPRAGVDTTNYGFNNGGGTCTAARVATGGPAADCPSLYRLSFTAAATGDVQIRNGATGVNVVTAGSSYRFAAATRASWAGAKVQVVVGWYTDGTFLSSTSGTAVFPNANEWVTPSAVGTAPAGANRAQVTVYALASGGVLPGVGATFDASAFIGHLSTTPAVGVPYHDGGSTDWSWSGTAHASTSSGPALVG